MKANIMSSEAKNVLGEPLQPCGYDPLTGFYRDGCCDTGSNDAGVHVVCAVMTAEFLEHTRARGNDLSTPQPGFPGLKAGDRWCLCATRWRQAWQDGVTPLVVLEATHEAALEYVGLDVLQRYAASSDSDQGNN